MDPGIVRCAYRLLNLEKKHYLARNINFSTGRFLTLINRSIIELDHEPCEPTKVTAKSDLPTYRQLASTSHRTFSSSRATNGASNSQIDLRAEMNQSRSREDQQVRLRTEKGCTNTKGIQIQKEYKYKRNTNTNENC
jgi:hypothetical protein